MKEPRHIGLRAIEFGGTVLLLELLLRSPAEEAVGDRNAHDHDVQKLPASVGHGLVYELGGLGREEREDHEEDHGHEGFVQEVSEELTCPCWVLL